MFSYGEILLTLAAAIALFGPNDVPIIARSAGRLVGRAVGYLQTARGQVDSVMKKTQVDQVQKELRETMAQLDAIRHEIRSGMSISNPGPMTRSVLTMERDAVPDSSPVQVQSVVSHVKVSPPTLQNGADKVPETGSGLVFEAEELGRDMRSSLPSPADPRHLKPGDFEVVSTSASATVGAPGFQPGPDGTFSTMPSSTQRIAAQRIVVKPVGVSSSALPSQQESGGAGVGHVVQDVTVLPISAVSAGILPPRTGPLPGGADLVLESVTERRVAFDTKEFLQQSDPLLR